jgi:integrase/recombinase XerC
VNNVIVPFPDVHSRTTPQKGGEIMRADSVVRAHLHHLELEGLAGGTVEARRRALLRLQAAIGMPLLEAAAADLAAWRAGLTIDPDSVAAYVSHARQFYEWAIGAGLLAGPNPAGELPVPRRPRRLPRPISERDMFAAVAGAPPRIRPWLVLAGWAGLRAKEIALLRRQLILDTARPPVLIVAADATKGRNERVVPLCAFVLGELLEAGMPASGWMFRRRDGRPGPNSPAKVSQLANRYLHEAGIAATLHQCRHRFGTETYRARRDLRMLQELMGHQRPETTAGYVLVDAVDAAAVLEQLPIPGRLQAVGE